MEIGLGRLFPIYDTDKFKITYFNHLTLDKKENNVFIRKGNNFYN